MKQYATNIFEVGLKFTRSDFKKVKLFCSADCDKYARQFYFDDINIYESFFLIMLNRANITTGYTKISQGGVCGTIVDPVIIAKYAVNSLSRSVVLCHNHPSGSLIPSDADVQITRRIAQGLKLFDISVIDHIILGAEGYYSFADEGML